MKINKIHYALFAAILIIALATFLVNNFDYFANQEADSNSSAKTTEQNQSLAKTQAETQSGAINELLQHKSGTSPKIAPSDIVSGMAPASEAEDLETLQEALNDFYSAEDGEDREASLMTIGEYPDPKAKEAILYALNDPEDSVREQAVSQISNWEDEKESQQMLLVAMGNDKPEIVVLALEAVTELDDPALMEKVRELSNDKNEDISEAAKTALEMADGN